MRTTASSSPSLLVFGSINVDLVVSPDRLPQPGETVLAPGYRMAGGGKGANRAIAAAPARSNPNRRILMIGAVGSDEFGGRALDELRADGLVTDHIIRVPAGSPIVRRVSNYGSD